MSNTPGIATPSGPLDTDRQTIETTGPITTITIDIRGADTTIGEITTPTPTHPTGAITRIGIFAQAIATSITSIGRTARGATT